MKKDQQVSLAECNRAFQAQLRQQSSPEPQPEPVKEEVKTKPRPAASRRGRRR